MKEKTKVARRKAGRRAKRKLSGRTIGILSFVTIMLVIIILSALYQNKPQPIEKEKADEYFRFSGAIALARATDEPNSTILISELIFNVTAVGGNATEVLIFPRQGSVPLKESPYFDEITQGESVEVIIEYPYSVLSKKNTDGYPVKFRVTCNEAEGEITIYVTELIPLSS